MYAASAPPVLGAASQAEEDVKHMPPPLARPPKRAAASTSAVMTATASSSDADVTDMEDDDEEKGRRKITVARRKKKSGAAASAGDSGWLQPDPEKGEAVDDSYLSAQSANEKKQFRVLSTRRSEGMPTSALVNESEHDNAKWDDSWDGAAAFLLKAHGSGQSPADEDDDDGGQPQSRTEIAKNAAAERAERARRIDARLARKSALSQKQMNEGMETIAKSLRFPLEVAFPIVGVPLTVDQHIYGDAETVEQMHTLLPWMITVKTTQHERSPTIPFLIEESARLRKLAANQQTAPFPLPFVDEEVECM